MSILKSFGFYFPTFKIVDINLDDDSCVAQIIFKKRTSIFQEKIFSIRDTTGFWTVWSLVVMSKALAEKEFASLKKRDKAVCRTFSNNYLNRQLPASFKELLKKVKTTFVSKLSFYDDYEMICLLFKLNSTWRDFFNNFGQFLEERKSQIGLMGSDENFLNKFPCDLYILNGDENWDKVGVVNLRDFGFWDFEFGGLIDGF